MIYCTTIETFLDTVLGLTMRGITFKADAETFEIRLTGGY
jgi:hypothetical protein